MDDWPLVLPSPIIAKNPLPQRGFTYQPRVATLCRLASLPWVTRPLIPPNPERVASSSGRRTHVTMLTHVTVATLLHPARARTLRDFLSPMAWHPCHLAIPCLVS